MFRNACTNKTEQQTLAGDKHHWYNHAYHFMEHHRFSVAWMDDQRTEATMRFALQWFRKYKNHLTQAKASTMMTCMNLTHDIEFDASNSKVLYEETQ